MTIIVFMSTYLYGYINKLLFRFDIKLPIIQTKYYIIVI